LPNVTASKGNKTERRRRRGKKLRSTKRVGI
jgi:hypothetical protein